MHIPDLGMIKDGNYKVGFVAVQEVNILHKSYTQLNSSQ